MLGSLALTVPNYFLLRRLDAMQTPQEDLQLFASQLVIGLLSYVVGHSYQLRRNLANELAERKKSDARFEGLFGNTNDAVFILSPSLAILDVNNQATGMLGYTPGELVGQGYHQFVVQEERSNVDTRLDEVLSGKRLPFYERSLKKKDGSLVSVEVNAAAILDERGRPLHVQSLCRDITERKLAEEKLFHQATHYDLTGLFNRAMFFSHLDQTVRYQGRQDQRLGVLFLDLDGFKVVNDTYGHAAGDELLKQSAERMQTRLRKAISSLAWVAMNLPSFLTTLTDEKYASHVEQVIEDVLNAPFDIDGKTVKVSASVGVSIPRDALGAETFIKIADQGMYEAKQKKHKLKSLQAPGLEANRF